MRVIFLAWLQNFYAVGPLITDDVNLASLIIFDCRILGNFLSVTLLRFQNVHKSVLCKVGLLLSSERWLSCFGRLLDGGCGLLLLVEIDRFQLSVFGCETPLVICVRQHCHCVQLWLLQVLFDSELRRQITRDGLCWLSEEAGFTYRGEGSVRQASSASLGTLLFFLLIGLFLIVTSTRSNSICASCSSRHIILSCVVRIGRSSFYSIEFWISMGAFALVGL